MSPGDLVFHAPGADPHESRFDERQIFRDKAVRGGGVSGLILDIDDTHRQVVAHVLWPNGIVRKEVLSNIKLQRPRP